MTEDGAVYLTEIDDFSDAECTEYPCVIIDGIETENEFLHFRNRRVDDPDVCVPMFFECEGEMVRLGMFPLTLDFLLTIRGIGGYRITLQTDGNTQKAIDLDDAETLCKFIKL